MAEHEPGRPRFQIAEREATSGRAVVVVPILRDRSDVPRRSDEAKLAEAEGLARAIELQIVASGICPVTNPRPATLLGTGKSRSSRA